MISLDANTPNPETLYDFRVNIKQSSIPNSGHGAFLTYLGARVLKPEVMKRSARLMEQHTITFTDTHDHITAKTVDGRVMDVKLTGDNLHYNDNNIYWTKPRLDKHSNNVKHADAIRRGKMESYDENHVLCHVHDEVEELRNCVPDGNGIGFLGINKESDYM